MVEAKKHHELYGELGSIVGSKYVSDDDFVLLSYTRDVSVFPPGRPQGVVVRPSSVEEVVELVRLANQTRTPLIPMGGKASIASVPPGQPGRGIIVDMRRMDKVLEIDEANMAVTAQCGIMVAELAAKVNEKGWGIHTAAAPHYIDTLGGHISGITGGGFSFVGWMIGYNWHHMLGLKVVLPNGSIVDTGTGEGGISTSKGHSWARAVNGPDITGIFIGDGGIFGIKVEATYQMFRLPKFTKSSARCWDTVDEAYQAYYELWETGASFLYMQPSITLIVPPETIGFATMGAGEPLWAVLFDVLAQSEEELELKYKTTDEFLAKKGGRLPDPATLSFANNYLPLVRNMGAASSTGQFPLFELIVPRSHHLEVFKWSRDWIFNKFKERGIDVSKIYFLGALLACGAGWGMTSMVPTFDPSDRELHEKMHKLLVEFLEEGSRRGYVCEVTQSHLSRLKAKYWTPEVYNFNLNLKKMLDPNNIMNPGVFFP